MTPWEIERRTGGYQSAAPKKVASAPKVGSPAWKNTVDRNPDRNSGRNEQQVIGWISEGMRQGSTPDPGGSSPAQQWAPSSPGGGGRSGGGGGGGSAQAGAQSQIDMLMGLLQSGQLASPKREFSADQALRDEWTGAVSADREHLGNSMDGLDTYLAGLGNAYNDAPIAEGASVQNADLANLMRSQGGSDAGLLAQAEFLQSQNDSSAAASNRYASALRSSQDNWNQSVQSEGRQARAYGDAEISAADRGGQAALSRRDADERKRIDDQNFQMRLADRQAMLQLITQISSIAGGAGIKSPAMDFEKLLGAL